MTPTEMMQAAVRQADRWRVEYPGVLVLFRIGDFYEMFGEDARRGAKIIGLTTTNRGGVDLAGFVHDTLDRHLRTLVDAGVRVAVVDQVADRGVWESHGQWAERQAKAAARALHRSPDEPGTARLAAALAGGAS